METQDDDYELEERAAIRELEGGFPRDVAKSLARDDIEARTAQQNCLNRHRQYEKQQQNEPRKIQQPEWKQPPEKPELQALRDRRDEVSKKMTAENDPKRKNELFAEWKAIIQKIGVVKKGA